ncbi:MAG: endonuclease III [Thermotogae bacterium]|uniref:endonuclease III n=1 Tax=Kosmotoga sp. TaxID=1955248 RepID=UPI000F17A325|nr:endonuclease III [Kosmotoga sp.]MCD6159458.1 endonuclease III [Kosmotoga sp.]RKX48427.1 MAG: endonuclease III [Thermotogota bacterium]
MKHCEPNEIARKIIEAFPRKHNEKDPFKVLVSTILSQRTRDENTDEASRRLFARYKDPMSIAKADPEELYELIRPAGMYRQKAERIIMVAKQLLERYQGKVPSELHKLLDLPGVGRKTANIVLNISFGIPALAVDTHVHRISNRLGWVKTSSPEDTERELMNILNEKLWGPINGSMVEFGRRLCKPRNPMCDECPVKACCALYLSSETH